MNGSVNQNPGDHESGKRRAESLLGQFPKAAQAFIVDLLERRGVKVDQKSGQRQIGDYAEKPVERHHTPQHATESTDYLPENMLQMSVNNSYSTYLSNI